MEHPVDPQRSHSKYLLYRSSMNCVASTTSVIANDDLKTPDRRVIKAKTARPSVRREEKEERK